MNDGRVRDIGPASIPMRISPVKDSLLRGHGPQKGGNFHNPDIIAALADNSAAQSTFRQNVFARIRSPRKRTADQSNYYFMPMLSGDEGDATVGEPDTWLYLLETQYSILERWAAGDFTNDWDPHAPPPPPIEQIALADFIDSGKYARHLRRMWRLYQQRRSALVAAIERHMGDLLTVSSDAGGMHLTVRLDAPLRDQDVSAATREHGLHIAALSAFCQHPERDAEHYNGFMLGYAGVKPQEADALVARLAAVVRGLL